MRKLKVVMLFLFCLLVIFVSANYMIRPGIKKINMSNHIIVLSDEEIVDKVKKILDDYNVKKDLLQQNYLEAKGRLDTKYVDLIKVSNDKYKKLEEDIRTKYNAQIKALDSKYNLSDMLAPGWYENSVKKMNEESELRRKMNQEISDNTSDSYGAKKLIDEQKRIEESNLKNNLETNLNALEIEKNSNVQKTKNIDVNKEKYMKSGKYHVVSGVIVIVALALWFVGSINRLIRRKNKVEEKWAQIDVLLKKRNDLIPNLVSCVKGYARHEKDTLESVVEARDLYKKSKTREDKIESSNKLDLELKNIMILSESYPELKTDESFLKLQQQLVETEDSIARFRIYYNKSVLKYMNRINMFPSNLFAALLNYKEIKYYYVDDGDKRNIEVVL